MIDIDQLKSDLETYINNINSSSDVEEIMIVTSALNSLTVDRIPSVATVNDLPDLDPVTSYLPEGSIFFVDSIKVLVYSNGAYWRGIDDRILRYDGPPFLTARAWGNNSSGQLGDNSTTNKSSPVTVVGGITNWTQVSAGPNSAHNAGINVNGILYAWGNNNYGRLGDNTTTSRLSPVTPVGGIINWKQVSVGDFHTLAIASGGFAYSWGSNGNGELGTNSTSARSSPVTVVGGITNWAQVSVGGNSSFGITATGILYAWGRNAYGQLGDNSTSARSSPVTVVGGITNWAQVSSGRENGLGVTSTGIAYAWGRNTYGRLGDNTTTSRLSPVTVVGGITSWEQVSAGGGHSLGVTSTGIAYAWGRNNYGQLGDNSTTSKSSPVTVVGGITNWAQVSAGDRHSLGLTSTGIAYAWGLNNAGRLGDNSTTNRSSPVTVVGGITNWTQVFAAGTHSIGAFLS
jgi:alpha-tubulin suppressor-like RCC1 family protein